jgi:hypothetical protein
MRIRVVRTFAAAILLIALATPAAAQYGARPYTSNRATGETYNLEASGLFWSPTPDITLSSAGSGNLAGIRGSDINFQTDLGIEKKKLNQLKVVLRPGTKHKFRFEYTPIEYTSNAVLKTRIVFNGQAYNIGVPVLAELKWKAYRFGYEYDFAYFDRGFVGVLLDLKYTDVNASLTSAFVGNGTEFAHARAPIPAIGVVGRGYVVPNVSITGEFSAFKFPDTIVKDYEGTYYDFDLYGTVNFNDHIGAQVGFRSLDVGYTIKQDVGAMTLKGPYFGVVARF